MTTIQFAQSLWANFHLTLILGTIGGILLIDILERRYRRKAVYKVSQAYKAIKAKKQYRLQV